MLSRPTNILTSVISVLLYLAGAFVIGLMSVWVLWGELESNTYFPFNNSASLPMTCPLVLSPAETGTIRATVLNSINEDTKPMVSANFSAPQGPHDLTQILNLAPGQSQTLEWTVDRSDIIYDRLILVNINQYRYSKLDSRRGACGIMILGLFGLSGGWSLILPLAFGLLLMGCGAGLWIHNHSARGDYFTKVIQIGRLFGLFIFAGMTTAALRWWGLIIVFDFMAFIALTVAFTDVLLSPDKEIARPH